MFKPTNTASGLKFYMFIGYYKTNTQLTARNFVSAQLDILQDRKQKSDMLGWKVAEIFSIPSIHEMSAIA